MNMQRHSIAKGDAPFASAAGRFSGRSSAIGANFAEIAYIFFLLMVFVGVTPFARPDATPGIDPASASGAGDVVRQICYLAAFGFIAGAAWMRRARLSIDAIPVLIAVLLAWCVLSAAWSLEPSVTIRRGVLLSVVAASAFIAVDTIGAPRALQLLRYVLAAIIIVNWISIFLIPQARHFANDLEPGVAGDWRGLYVFLIGTDSKSSLGLLPVAIVAGGVYFFCAGSAINRRIVFTASLLAATVAFAALWMFWGPIAGMLQDPALLTGRSAIWQAELAFIRDHPALGSGFGSFAYTGKNSPIYQYIDSSWIGGVASGHQGYLQLLVTIGIPGFLIAMLCLFVQPIVWFSRGSKLDLPFRSLLFALFSFFFLHNFMESNFLNTDGPEWVTFLLVLAMLRTSREPAKAGLPLPGHQSFV
ncbi:MAG: O-antigen ligase family protein [Rhizomicrobium sp.]